ncbi:MAG: EF-P lysine aminoacylase GenX [Syntrophus sp. (in: bacteria)]|nr:EF-P lysine aminoacylase GenX [Syntrophus sp. (in: bacteria)]
MDESWRLAGKRGALRRRALMIRAIRQFFYDRDYLEVETPIRIPAPAPEEHIDAAPSGDWFLQTSPELCMKRMLAAGYPGIFQISKCFRAGERGRFHLPEFTMLEWYGREGDCETLMQECEALVIFIARALDGADTLAYQGMTIALQPPWERISVTDAFVRYAHLSMQQALEKGCFDEIMACEIEPRFGDGRPVFLYDFPVARGALARAKKTDPELAERFELYMGGLELANAFSELTDEKEQRLRFEKAQRLRRAAGKVVYPMPEPFLSSLRCMPEAAGIALGVDRLAMLFTDSAHIDEIVAFTTEML